MGSVEKEGQRLRWVAGEEMNLRLEVCVSREISMNVRLSRLDEVDAAAGNSRSEISVANMHGPCTRSCHRSGTESPCMAQHSSKSCAGARTSVMKRYERV